MKRKETIVDAINAVLGTNYEAEKIEGNMLLVDDLLFDSISLIRLVVELEDRFDVSMDELEDFSVFETVESVCNYLNQLIG